jgi:hypothetical protein
MNTKCLRVAALLSLLLSPALTPSVRAQNSALAFSSPLYAYVPAAAFNVYPLTIMCWFRTTQTNAVMGLVNKYYSGSLSGYQMYITTTGHLSGWYFRDGANNVWGDLDGGFVADGLWHHGAMVIDAAGSHLYVDGVLKSTVPWVGAAGVTISPFVLSFGYYQGADFLNGQMDEVSVWNTNLSAAQIQGYLPQPLAGNEAGLLGLWHFNEPSGTVVSNSTAAGSAYDGSFTGPVGRFPFPIVTTQPATAISTVGATLNATANTLYLQATAWFQWGLTTNYGNVTGPISLAATNVAVPVSALVTGLSPSATYHYSVIVSNATGVNFGSDATFATQLFSQISTPLPAIQSGSAAWGDYDNDGLLDVVIAGTVSGLPATQVWRNTGSGFTKTVDLTGVSPGSAVWGDYDNDGRLDLLISGTGIGNTPKAEVWRNTGISFTNINAGLVGVQSSAGAWGDFNNDGRLDILLTGTTAGSAQLTQLWQNTGHGFDPVPAGLPGVTGGSVSWGDYDNDGWLDILITGVDSTAHPIAQVWRNVGGTFVDSNAGLPGISNSSGAWGDYDNDGRLDILISGSTGTGLTQVWRNTGSGFTNINAGLPGLSFGSVAWGDCDNDGRPDALIAGLSGGVPFTQVWQNTPGGFIMIANLTGIVAGSAVWGDYNNDGRLDIFLVGANVTQLWQNQTPVTNTPPSAPTGLSATFNGLEITFNWNAASDAQTPAGGLSYNVRVGSATAQGNLTTPMSGNTGFRRVPHLGNRGHTFTLTTLVPTLGKLYWSVQAVDSAMAGSPFATENAMNILPVAAPVSANTVTTGDLNGDGVVDSSELNAVYSKYLLSTPGFAMTNVAGLGQSNVTFGISNAPAGIYSVQVSSNLIDWQTLGSALPRYLFTDTNASIFAPRYYRLSYP